MRGKGIPAYRHITGHVSLSLSLQSANMIVFPNRRSASVRDKNLDKKDAQIKLGTLESPSAKCFPYRLNYVRGLCGLLEHRIFDHTTTHVHNMILPYSTQPAQLAQPA